jgi:SEC-C motif domain protein
MSCFCGNPKGFEFCCQPIIERKRKAETALQLMQSRYSAYATLKADYLINSTHKNARKLHNKSEIASWAADNKWEKLEIVSSQNGSAMDEIGFVEFKAYFIDKQGKKQIHHEYSTFLKEEGIWYYLTGRFE